MSYPPLADMRAQFETQLNAWGSDCDILRFDPSSDNTGRKVGSYSSLFSNGATEKIWIQALGGDSSVAAQGLNAETTHLAYQAYGGTALIPKDRVVPSGSEFAFDVIRSYTRETHRETELKQVRRI